MKLVASPDAILTIPNLPRRHAGFLWKTAILTGQEMGIGTMAVWRSQAFLHHGCELHAGRHARVCNEDGETGAADIPTRILHRDVRAGFARRRLA